MKSNEDSQLSYTKEVNELKATISHQESQIQQMQRMKNSMTKLRSEIGFLLKENKALKEKTEKMIKEVENKEGQLASADSLILSLQNEVSSSKF
ncbi:MAG: hypothetical protein MHPSP_004107, partial [Paramarteilia canceri]